jgi:predicted amidohydrolase YtcJ
MPEQCLTFDESLALYTTEAAYAANVEQKLGNLKPGFLADFIILNKDIRNSPSQLVLPSSILLHSVWVHGTKRL